jgi:chemotaxis signal transduction protein/DNA-binding XRE family transcriptional regulator
MQPDGVLVQQARLKAGLSQRGLAQLAGTSQAMVARIEGGRQSPSLATLRRLLKACGADIIVQVDGESLPSEKTEASPEHTQPGQFLLVHVGDQPIAIALTAVREVLAEVAPSGLPGQPAAMVGAVVMRGEVLPCVDLAASLGMPPAAASAGAVLESRDGPLVALVTEARDVRELSAQQILPIPPGWTSCDVLRDLAQVDDGLVPVLDTRRLGLAGPHQEHSSATHRR